MNFSPFLSVAKRFSKSSTAPKHLRDGLVIRIKAVTFTLFPSGFQFGPGDVPVRTALPQHSTQVLPELFDGRSAKKPVAVIDLEYNQTCTVEVARAVEGQPSGRSVSIIRIPLKRV